MTVSFGKHQIESQPSLRYVGVQVDTRLCFVIHADLIAAKRTTEAQKLLAYLMPNTRGPRQAELKGKVQINFGR